MDYLTTLEQRLLILGAEIFTSLDGPEFDKTPVDLISSQTRFIGLDTPNPSQESDYQLTLKSLEMLDSTHHWMGLYEAYLEYSGSGEGLNETIVGYKEVLDDLIPAFKKIRDSMVKDRFGISE